MKFKIIEKVFRASQNIEEKRGLIKMERMDDGVVSQKLAMMYDFAKDARVAIDSINTIYTQDKIPAVYDDYKSTISQYETMYGEYAEQITLHADDNKKLIDFIFEWGKYDPDIVLAFANKFHLKHCFKKIVER
ncbi:hypothetical protein SDC9_59725 [bioreactor metagenome]|uniref:Uncharacterized protein n=1 Tax=bioreactor metagenome TaxID=1076179 RepID=A0A644XC58_9ZZZZ